MTSSSKNPNNGIVFKDPEGAGQVCRSLVMARKGNATVTYSESSGEEEMFRGFVPDLTSAPFDQEVGFTKAGYSRSCLRGRAFVEGYPCVASVIQCGEGTLQSIQVENRHWGDYTYEGSCLDSQVGGG